MNEEKGFQEGSVCARCGRNFICGMKAGHAKCWCADLPHQPPPDPDAKGCYCPDCLKQMLESGRQPRNS